MSILHFLITDDNQQKREMLGIVIGRTFPTASIYECYSGQEALDYFSKNRVDVIVTDHDMAPVNGLELIEAVRRTGSTVPIIMVTGFVEIGEEARAAGANLVVTTRDIGKTGARIRDFLKAHRPT